MTSEKEPPGRIPEKTGRPAGDARFDETGRPRWWKAKLPFSERRALLVLGDLLMLWLAGWISAEAWVAVNRSRGGGAVLGESHILWLFLLGLVWMSAAAVNDCYDLRRAADPRRMFRSIVLTATTVWILYIITYFFLAHPVTLGHRRGRTVEDIGWLFTLVAMYRPPRIIPTVFVLVALAAVSSWRWAYAGLLTSHPLRRRILILGFDRRAMAAADAIRSGMVHADIVGFVTCDPVEDGFTLGDIPVWPFPGDLEPLVRRTDADEVVLAADRMDSPGLIQSLIRCREGGVDVRPMAEVYEEALRRSPVQFYENDVAMVPYWGPRRGLPFYALFKRLIDLAGGVIILGIFLLVLPFAALAILIDSGRPVFYRQERMGREGRIFRLIKFRTMVQGAEPEGRAVWAAEKDPRVTRVGRFLRRTRLDELPQCINVLRGEMSLVGPRPERPEFVRELEERIPLYRTRFWVKPGLTGWAQIRYRYGNTFKDTLIKLQFDVYYVRHQSFWLDLMILLRTVKVVLAMRGT